MKLFLTITILMVSSCGYQGDTEGNLPELTIERDEILQEYLDEFINDLSFYKDPYSTNLSKLKTLKFSPKQNFYREGGKNVIGYCTTTYDYKNNVMNNEVHIREDMKASPKCTLRMLVYHELGHCALSLGHDDNGLKIMNTFLPRCVGNDDWEDMKEELFLSAD